MDGYETVQLLRQNEDTKFLPVIFVSAYLKEDLHLIKGIETGAVDFITKPLQPEIIKGKVKIFIELYQQRKEIEQYAHDLLLMNNRIKEEMTKRKSMEKQLVRQEKLAILGQMAGGVGHELRNPLGAMKNAIYFLNMAIESIESRS
jgi:response regulator RpfG family c-di-GMP phosphodiesterase